MQKKGANISLKGYDDIFSTDQSRAEAQQERVQEIPLSELHPFEGHPFRVVDDEEMMKTAESVRDFGVLTPAIVRPDPDGGYEIVSGHRRHRASELAGKETMPAIVRDLDDDAAIILMVDANLQRESILPSERAFAYKMKLDAIKHQGQRTDLTSSQVGMKLQAMDIVGQEAGESRNQVHRYIRLTELIPELLDMVDTGQIKFNPAVELSYLASEEQKDFLSAMDYAQAAPSLSQAQRIKKLAQEGECTLDAMCEIMNKDNADTIIGNMDSRIFLGGSEPTTLKELNQALGKETIDTYNTSNTRGNSPSYGQNFQKLGKDLASVDELAVLDGSKCILQLRGVRPFLSDKYDLAQHPNYKYTSDFDKRNEFNIEQFLSRRLKLKAGDEFVVVDAD